MKQKTRSLIAPLLVLAAAALTGCATRSDYVSLYGQPSPISGAEYTIVITPETRHINVEGGQVVGFVVGDKRFAWHFFVANHITSFPLNDVAPAGILDHPVEAYVSPDPRYWPW